MVCIDSEGKYALTDEACRYNSSARTRHDAVDDRDRLFPGSIRPLAGVMIALTIFDQKNGNSPYRR